MSSTAARLLDALVARDLTLAVAESLTGGLVQSTLVDVPGASRALRGGVLAYATDVKSAVLGVDAALLAQRGAVDADVALAMAHGVARLLGADVGLATTGVAGPGDQDGVASGVVFLAAAWADEARAREGRVVELALDGDRGDIRRGATEAVLKLGRQFVT